MRKYYQDQSYFILDQILHIYQFVHIQNEFERNDLSILLRDFLISSKTPANIVACILGILENLHHRNDLLRIVLEVLADITEKEEQPQHQLEEPDLTSSSIFSSSSVPQKQQTFSKVVLKQTLTICEELLRNTNYRSENNRASLVAILETIILPSVQNVDSNIRLQGLKCLGLFCLLNKDDAAEFLLLFVQAVQKDDPSIQLVAEKSIFDFLAAFDPLYLIGHEKDWPMDIISQTTELGEKIRSDEKVYNFCCNEIYSITITTLVTLLRHSDPEIRFVAVEGFAKLLLNDSITDHHILSIFVILYFHPAIVDTPRLLQCLNCFFCAYAISDEHKNCIFQSFHPTIKRIVNSGKYSPLRNIVLSDLFAFVLKLLKFPSQNHTTTDDNDKCQTSIPTYTIDFPTIIIETVEEIVTSKNYFYITQITKILEQHLDVSDLDPFSGKKLFTLLRKFVTNYNLDNSSLKTINDLSSGLTSKFSSLLQSDRKRSSTGDEDELSESPPKHKKITQTDSPYTVLLNTIPRTIPNNITSFDESSVDDYRCSGEFQTTHSKNVKISPQKRKLDTTLYASKMSKIDIVEDIDNGLHFSQADDESDYNESEFAETSKSIILLLLSYYYLYNIFLSLVLEHIIAKCIMERNDIIF